MSDYDPSLEHILNVRALLGSIRDEARWMFEYPLRMAYNEKEDQWYIAEVLSTFLGIPSLVLRERKIFTIAPQFPQGRYNTCKYLVDRQEFEVLLKKKVELYNAVYRPKLTLARG